MNQRGDNPGTDQGERGRETNDSRDFYPGSHGFDETTHRAYGGPAPSGRGTPYSQTQTPQGQYERDPYAQGQRRPGHYGQDQYGQGQHGPGQYGGAQHAQSGPGRYGPGQQGEGSHGSEHWHGGPPFNRPHYGGGGRDYSRQVDYLYGPQRYQQHRYEPGYGAGQGGSPARGYGSGADELGYGAGAGRYGAEWGRPVQYGQRPYPHGRAPYGASQYGQRPYGWSDQDRPAQYAQPQYGHGSFPPDEYGHEHSSEQLFGRAPFARDEGPYYFGTGTPGWGGPGFTGGAYAYGNGPPQDPHLQETEYPSESYTAYGQGNRWSYGAGGRSSYNPYGMVRNRPFPRGPKGYQRSDERLKEDISERLMEAAHIDSSEVSVDVRGAKVILDGIVPDRRMKHAIEDLVDACPGVQDIDNRVRVGSSLPQAGGPSGTSPAGTPSATVAGNSTTSAAGVGSARTTGTPNGGKPK
jgi:BON domain